MHDDVVIGAKNSAAKAAHDRGSECRRRSRNRHDWVLAMTGYHPDFDFLGRLGIALSDDRSCTPMFNETTL